MSVVYNYTILPFLLFFVCLIYTFLLFVMHDQIENKLFEYGLEILY